MSLSDSRLRLRQFSSEDMHEETGERADDKEKLSHAHRRCWCLFVSVLASVVCIIGISALMLALREHRKAHKESQDYAEAHRASRHTVTYFVLCVVGGILSGIPHALIAPVDVVKCRMQIGEASEMGQGLRHLWSEARQQAAARRVACETTKVLGKPSWRRGLQVAASAVTMYIMPTGTFLSVFFKGWPPALIGYCIQGALKFGLYEYFTYRYASWFSYETVVAHITLIFLAASASAELIADVALAPFETLKIRIQTSRPFSQPSMSSLLPAVWFSEGLKGFYRCLVPLWCRQVPYTMVKFTTFESCASAFAAIVRRFHANQHAPLLPWERLVVALLAGYAAGALCAVVTQPADVVVSKLSASTSVDGPQRPWTSIVRELGVTGLFRGLSARVAMVGTLSAAQWVIYDGFKTLSGLGSSH